MELREPRETLGGNAEIEARHRLDCRGAALIDLVFTCGLILVLAAITIPTLQASRERDVARMAARYLADKLQLLRVEAVRRNRSVAMRFDPDDLGHIASYLDRDGDGVLQSDIDAGIDTALDAAAHLRAFFATVELRVAATVPMPDGGGVIAADSDPVRIGNSNLVSFNPLGSSTSGTIYLAARDGSQMCVRLFGATGRVRVLLFDRASATWRPE